MSVNRFVVQDEFIVLNVVAGKGSSIGDDFIISTSFYLRPGRY